MCVARDIELARKAQDQRETYVATLTHDLKTPTIAQIKALDLLLSNTMGELNKDQKDMMIMIKDSCTYMHEMLSNLLSTYKYENGDYTLNLESSDILELIEDVSQELESLLKEKNVKMVGEGVGFERIRRITGYLVGTLDRFNNAKRQEVEYRVKHSGLSDEN